MHKIRVKGKKLLLQQHHSQEFFEFLSSVLALSTANFLERETALEDDKANCSFGITSQVFKIQLVADARNDSCSASTVLLHSLHPKMKFARMKLLTTFVYPSKLAFISRHEDRRSLCLNVEAEHE